MCDIFLFYIFSSSNVSCIIRYGMSLNRKFANFNVFVEKVTCQIYTQTRIFSLSIDSQRHGLKTRAKFLMLLTLHPWYGLKRFIFKPCNFFTLTIFRDFLFAYFKHERPCQCTQRLLKLLWEIKNWKPKFNSCFFFDWQKYHDFCCEKSSIETFRSYFWTCL